MANANAVQDLEDLEGDYFVGENGNTDPIMPHRVYDKAQLRKLYPPLEVPEEEDDEDLEHDDDDILLKAGERQIDEIIRNSELCGRKRRVLDSQVED
jgi:hypothetical protein